MSTPDNQTPTEPEGQTPAELRADIENTRAELGATVEALGDKLNMKDQVQQSVTEVKERVADAATTSEGQIKPIVLAVSGALVVVLTAGGIVSWMIWRNQTRNAKSRRRSGRNLLLRTT